jgi:hypothetical protein
MIIQHLRSKDKVCKNSQMKISEWKLMKNKRWIVKKKINDKKMNRKKKNVKKRRMWRKERKENWILYSSMSSIKVAKLDKFINMTRENEFLRINNSFVDKIYS